MLDLILPSHFSFCYLAPGPARPGLTHSAKSGQISIAVLIRWEAEGGLPDG